MIDILLFPLTYALLTIALAVLSSSLQEDLVKMIMFFAVLISLGYTGFMVSYIPNLQVISQQQTNSVTGITTTSYQIYIKDYNDFLKLTTNYNYIMIGIFFVVAFYLLLKAFGISVNELMKYLRKVEKVDKAKEYDRKYVA
jgi:glucan phosphoethanolaminetransferase (alkaline phosphatase superfamily)